MTRRIVDRGAVKVVWKSGAECEAKRSEEDAQKNPVATAAVDGGNGRASWNRVSLILMMLLDAYLTRSSRKASTVHGFFPLLCCCFKLLCVQCATAAVLLSPIAHYIPIDGLRSSIASQPKINK